MHRRQQPNPPVVQNRVQSSVQTRMSEQEFSERLAAETLFDEELRRAFEARINFWCAIVAPVITGIVSYHRDLPKFMRISARTLSPILSSILLNIPVLFCGIAAMLATLAISTATGNLLLMMRTGYWSVEEPYRKQYNEQLVKFASPIGYEKSIVAGCSAVIFQQLLSHLFKSKEIGALGAGLSVGLLSWFGCEKPIAEAVKNSVRHFRQP